MTAQSIPRVQARPGAFGKETGCGGPRGRSSLFPKARCDSSRTPHIARGSEATRRDA